jgi:hypothetical protein
VENGESVSFLERGPSSIASNVLGMTSLAVPMSNHQGHDEEIRRVGENSVAMTILLCLPVYGRGQCHLILPRLRSVAGEAWIENGRGDE